MGWGKKKPENVPPRPTRTPASTESKSTPNTPERPATSDRGNATERSSGAERPASAERSPKKRDGSFNFGKSLRFNGELTGDEDFTIDGTVEGQVTLVNHNLTVGSNGHVVANVHAKTVVVVGTVVGNIKADDKVEVATSGKVDGDISAPSVILAEGARFRGNIDMQADSFATDDSTPAESPSNPVDRTTDKSMDKSMDKSTDKSTDKSDKGFQSNTPQDLRSPSTAGQDRPAKV